MNGVSLPFDNKNSSVNLGSRSGGTMPGDRMTASPWYDHLIYAFRNPENSTIFTGSVSNVPTGYNLLSGGYSFNGFGARGSFDQGSAGYYKGMFLGLNGGDRNFNNKLDRGPLPKSARLRAAFVARYNFYDPRLVLRLR
jgi:hypothetical protein